LNPTNRHVGLPELGVGFTFFPALENFIRSNINDIDVIEIEPQTFWYNTGRRNEYYKVNQDIVNIIKSFEVKKLIHSVAIPLGGTTMPELSQLRILAKLMRDFKSPWISEHLSFNKVQNPECDFYTNFFLPPRQTTSGIMAAVKAIKLMSRKISKPIAIENGVNYLKPRSDELKDGVFVSRVIEKANCGLILDLHNAWTNERNGRQSIKEFLDPINPYRIWEIHLGGGLDDDGYYLDAHSGGIPKKLVTVSRDVISKLPNLKAIIFEISEQYVPNLNTETLKSQLRILHSLWDLRGVSISTIIPRRTDHSDLQNIGKKMSPKDWELHLGALVIGRKINGGLSDQLNNDPGISVYAKLISTIRSSMIVNVIPFSSRLIIINIGYDKFTKLIASFQKKHFPELFAYSEARKFIAYLKKLNLKILELDAILKFELAFQDSLMSGRNHKLRFSFNILQALNSLAIFQKPDFSSKQDFEINLTRGMIKSMIENN